MQFLLTLIPFLFLITDANAQSQNRYTNFHEVDPGNFYRSAQLYPWEIEEYVAEHGIKTVINLRGARPGSNWYDRETAVLEKLGAQQIDISMSASRIPHRADLLRLLEAYENAPRPILIHCRVGADRTGEAAALYQMLYMGKTKEEALKMLSFKYGHMEFVFPAKRYFIKEVWQGLDWAYNDYDPCTGEYDHYSPEDTSQCRN